MTRDGSTDAALRLAATILLVRDDPFEVLTVQRHAGATFASAIVFPGGVVDPDDSDEEWLPLVTGGEHLDRVERAIRIAGIRETFEEAGLLLAQHADGSHVEQPDAAAPRFIDTVRESGGRLRLDKVVHFGHWITPPTNPKRFDTHFLLARAPRNQTATADGTEAVNVEWAAPSALIRRAEQGERNIMFPTYANLLRLAESGTATDALRQAAERPRFAVHARAETRPDGTRVSIIPAEAGYGITEFPL